MMLKMPLMHGIVALALELTPVIALSVAIDVTLEFVLQMTTTTQIAIALMAIQISALIMKIPFLIATSQKMTFTVSLTLLTTGFMQMACFT